MKNTTKISTIFFILLTVASFAQGGKHKEKREQVKAMKIAFITSELDLTPDESAKFWPLYNSFEDKQRELRKQKIGAYLDRKDNTEIEKMSEKDALTLLSQMEDNEEQLYQLRKKFVTSLKGVLPAVKIIKLKKAEEDFSRKLLQQYRDKRPKR